MDTFFDPNKALVETFSAKKTPSITISPLEEKKKEEKSPLVYSPEIPNVKFDTSLPAEVKNSMDQTQALAAQKRTAERMRQDELIQTIQQSQAITDDAEKKIEKSQNHIFGELIGLFDDDYDVSEQQRRIREATRNVQTKVATAKIEGFKDQLELQDASADYENYVKQQELKGKKIAFSAAELNMIVTSNNARKAAQDYAFSQVTHQEMLDVKKAGNYNEIITEQRVNKYLQDIEKAQLDLRASRLAYEADSLKLKGDYRNDARDLEKRALEVLPVQYLQMQLNDAVQAGQGRVQLGKDFFVSIQQVQDMIVTKNTTAEKFREQQAKQAVKLAQNNAEFNTLQAEMEMVSKDFYNGIDVQPLSKFNMLNVTDAALSEVDFGSIHPSAAPEYMALMSHYANMNGKGIPTEQDVETGRQLQASLKAKLDSLKKSQMDAQPDKESKAALQEWYNNMGNMKTGQNSATVVAQNMTAMPDFGGDIALENAFEVFQQNALEDLTGTTVNIFDEKGNLDTQTFLQNSLSQALKGKKTDQQMVLQNINKVGSSGFSPVSKYSNTKAAEVMLQAVRNLAQKNPAIKAALLDANGNPTQAWGQNGQNHNALSNILAQLSYDALQKDPSSAPNNLNFALQNEINEIIAKNAALWNKQLNMESGSFMVSLFNNKQPYKLIEMALYNTWGIHVNNSWDSVVNEKKIPQQTSAPFSPMFPGGF